MRRLPFSQRLFTAVVFLITAIFMFNSVAVANVGYRGYLRGRSARNTNEIKALNSELSNRDGGSLTTGKFIIVSEGKGLIHYLPRMIQRLAINNGTAHGNNYDAEGNLIQTQMNLKMTAAIYDAIKAYGVKIVQHGVTGTPHRKPPGIAQCGH